MGGDEMPQETVPLPTRFMKVTLKVVAETT
jgi:hypothetical protein